MDDMIIELINKINTCTKTNTPESQNQAKVYSELLKIYLKLDTLEHRNNTILTELNKKNRETSED